MFDPFDTEQVQAAWPLLSALRRDGPLAPLDGGMQYVTRHEGCRGVLRDVVSFSNASGFKAPGVVVRPDERILGEMDPPQHTAIRRLMVTALTPKVVHAAETFITTCASGLLESVHGSVDLVPAFTVPLPNRVTMHLLGLPSHDADTIAGWAKELMESGFPATNRSSRGEGFAAAFPEFASYIDDKIAEAASPLAAAGTVPGGTVPGGTVPGGTAGAGVLARLLEFDGGSMSLTQTRALVRNLITGGLTTTSQLLGNLVHELVTDLSLQEAVRTDRGLLGGAIEESLRLRPPVMFIVRGCIQDTEVAGCPLEAGQRVIVGSASANRDEQVFVDADEFQPDRDNADQHLTFGYGPHVCPGATLARAVARIGVETLLSRFGSIRPASDYHYENVPTFFECGPRSLRVEVVH